MTIASPTKKTTTPRRLREVSSKGFATAIIAPTIMSIIKSPFSIILHFVSQSQGKIKKRLEIRVFIFSPLLYLGEGLGVRFF